MLIRPFLYYVLKIYKSLLQPYLHGFKALRGLLSSRSRDIPGEKKEKEKRKEKEDDDIPNKTLKNQGESAHVRCQEPKAMVMNNSKSHKEALKI